MAIFGVGIDIVEINRIEKLFKKYPSRFVSRLLTEMEQQDFVNQKNKTLFLARRFAAKEAASKALGTGFSKGVSLTDFEVQHTSSGRPDLLIQGKAGKLVLEFGINSFHLSISDEEHYATAMVVFER